MGLFKKKKNYTFSPYDQKKGNNEMPLITAYDRIAYFNVTTPTEDVQYEICDKILSGHPAFVTIESNDITACNMMLSFISGVIYAKDGKVFKIESRLFLFGRKEEFEDGSLVKYMEDMK